VAQTCLTKEQTHPAPEELYLLMKSFPVLALNANYWWKHCHSS